MILLTVETSGPVASIALAGDVPSAVRTLGDAGRRHAQTLVSEVASLLTEARLAPRDVTAVAVSIGPGSFTGLRVGVVFAKTFAWATGAALVAVDTLEAIAERAPPDANDVWVLSDALRGDVYRGRYRRPGIGDRFSREGDVSIVPLAEWLPERRPGEWVTGPGAERIRDELESRGMRVPDAVRLHPRAENIARIGLAAFAAGQTADPYSLEPFYLRRPAAEENPSLPRSGIASADS